MACFTEMGRGLPSCGLESQQIEGRFRHLVECFLAIFGLNGVGQGLAAMKSTEVYGVLKQELAPMLTPAGFKRGRSFLSWSRASEDGNTVIWCQVSRDGWDSFAGSQFVVEFQRSAEPDAGARSSRRQRIAELLSDVDLIQAWITQNRIIAELRRPPPNHPKLQVSPEVSAWYLKKFEPVTEPFRNEDDIWFRYASPDHVKIWGRFLAERLPVCLEEFESRD
jgi:hypothetical protein